MVISFRRRRTLITSPIQGYTSSSSRACMSFHFGINGRIRRSHMSFLQCSALRLLVQPYLIRSAISCTQATMSLPHSSSNNIHSPNATNAAHQCAVREAYPSYHAGLVKTHPVAQRRPSTCLTNSCEFRQGKTLSTKFHIKRVHGCHGSLCGCHPLTTYYISSCNHSFTPKPLTSSKSSNYTRYGYVSTLSSHSDPDPPQQPLFGTFDAAHLTPGSAESTSGNQQSGIKIARQW